MNEVNKRLQRSSNNSFCVRADGSSLRQGTKYLKVVGSSSGVSQSVVCCTGKAGAGFHSPPSTCCITLNTWVLAMYFSSKQRWDDAFFPDFSEILR